MTSSTSGHDGNVPPSTTELRVDSGDDAIVNNWSLVASFDVDSQGTAALSSMFEQLWGKPLTNGDDSVYGIDPVVTVKRTDGQVTYIHVETKAARDRR